MWKRPKSKILLTNYGQKMLFLPPPNLYLHNYLKAELSPCHALEKNEVTDCLNSIITSQMIPVSFSEALFLLLLILP